MDSIRLGNESDASESDTEWEDASAASEWKRASVPAAFFRPPSRRSATTGNAVDEGGEGELSRESYEFARSMHQSVMLIAWQFVQRWVTTDSSAMRLIDVVRLAVGDDTKLRDMKSANDLLARMVERVVAHEAKR